METHNTKGTIYYINHDEERITMAELARKKTLNQHTYLHGRD